MKIRYDEENVVKYEMDSDQRFFFYIRKWAEKNCTFVAQGCDGRESSHLIDGMDADDVWGWLLPKGITRISDD